MSGLAFKSDVAAVLGGPQPVHADIAERLGSTRPVELFREGGLLFQRRPLARPKAERIQRADRQQQHRQGCHQRRPSQRRQHRTAPVQG